MARARSSGFRRRPETSRRCRGAIALALAALGHYVQENRILMSTTIEVREVDDFFDDPPICPFCGTQTIEPIEDGFDHELHICPHLQFYASDDD